MQLSKSTAWAVLVVVLGNGCVAQTARPSASVEVEPAAVCLGDDFETVVSLDASTSSSHLSLVPTADDAPLEFMWALSGDEYQVISGGLDKDRLEITMAGERPMGVRLTVRNEEGAEFSTQRSIAVTLDCTDERR